MNALAERAEEQTAVATVQPTANPVMDMIRQAVAAGQPLDVIRELKNMAKELAEDEARRAFDEAIAAAKAELAPIVRTRDGHNGKYADFADVSAGVDPVLSKYGLSYRHRSEVAEGKITVICKLSHKAGYFEETALPAPPDTSGNKNAIQAIGSTITYLQRYTLLLALGLATAHDDNGATGGGDGLSDDQVDALEEMISAAIAENKSDPAKYRANLLKYMRAETIGAIRSKDFAKAKAAIDSTRKK